MESVTRVGRGATERVRRVAHLLMEDSRWLTPSSKNAFHISTLYNLLRRINLISKIVSCSHNEIKFKKLNY